MREKHIRHGRIWLSGAERVALIIRANEREDNRNPDFRGYGKGVKSNSPEIRRLRTFERKNHGRFVVLWNGGIYFRQSVVKK